MQNKNVGYLILGISVVIIFIIFMFKSALTSFVDSSCTLAHGGDICPMYDTISQQTYLALGIVAILIIVGITLILSKPEEKILIKKVEKRKAKKIIDTSQLTKEEKQVLKIIQDNKTIFQADLIEKSGLGKVKISRILDKLENRNTIERKRRGMTNVVVLRED
jgi:high-affinity nickel permease